MSDKDKRIVKWYLEGCSVERIAKKIGMPGELWRVLDALKRNNLDPQSFGKEANEKV